MAWWPIHFIPCTILCWQFLLKLRFMSKWALYSTRYKRNINSLDTLVTKDFCFIVSLYWKRSFILVTDTVKQFSWGANNCWGAQETFPTLTMCFYSSSPLSVMSSPAHRLILSFICTVSFHTSGNVGVFGMLRCAVYKNSTTFGMNG